MSFGACLAPFSCCWAPRARQAQHGQRPEAPPLPRLPDVSKTVSPRPAELEKRRNASTDSIASADQPWDAVVSRSDRSGSVAIVSESLQHVGKILVSLLLLWPLLLHGDKAGPLSGALAAAGLAFLISSLVSIVGRCCGRGAADVEDDDLQTSAEAREIRDANWRSLGLQDDEGGKVRELQEAINDNKGTSVDIVTACSFLRAREWNKQEAEEMLRRASERRSMWMAASGSGSPAVGSSELSSMASQFRACRPLLRYWRGLGLAGRDHDGDPVLWERPGLLDWHGLAAAGEDAIVCCEILCMERIMQKFDQRTVEERRPVHRLTVVVDLEYLTMSFARPASLKIFKRLVQLVSESYPETLKRVLLVRPPPKFPAVWKLIREYFDPGTQGKIILVPAAETAVILQKYMPREHVPRFLGGPSRLPRLPSAGKIPRRLLQQLAQSTASIQPSVKARPEDVVDKEPATQGAVLRLAGLPQRLRARSRFSVKEASFPRSSWNMAEGTLPPPHSWGCVPDASAFPPPRRSSASGKKPVLPMMELLDVDVFRGSEDEPVWQVYDHPSLAAQHLRQHGDTRFFLVVNWIIGDFQLVASGALCEPVASNDFDFRMWQRFMKQPPLMRWRRLRVTAVCFEGPFIVNELIRPQKPGHLGKFLPSHSEGEDHLEIDVHLTSSEMRRMRVVLQHSSLNLAIGLAYFLCGDGPGEPPERLLFAHYISFVDIKRLRQVLS